MIQSDSLCPSMECVVLTDVYSSLFLITDFEFLSVPFYYFFSS